MSEVRSTHKRHREVMEKELRTAIVEMAADFPNSYRRFFPCYVFKDRINVPNPDYDAAWETIWELRDRRLADNCCRAVIPGPMGWAVQVGSGHLWYERVAHFRDEAKAKAFAVELLLKGLCFKIIYRKPR